MSYRVLVTETIAKEGHAFLREHGYEIKPGHGKDKALLISDLSDCDAALVRGAAFDEEVLSRSPRLKVVAKHGVGLDTFDLDAFRRHGVYLLNVPNANSISVAEHAMALMLASAKRMPFFCERYRAGDPDITKTQRTCEISGKTLGLIGCGNIGSHVARMASSGFQMEVIFYDPYLKAGREIPGATRVRTLEELLGRSDFISIHSPLTPETQGMISREQFSIMKPTAVLINAARGKIVDTNALIGALEKGVIAAAALDVTDPEPLNKDSPLFRMENIILTPHHGSGTSESLVRMAVGAAEGINAVLSGSQPESVIVKGTFKSK